MTVVDEASWGTVSAMSAETSLAFVTFRMRPEGLRDACGEALPHSLEGLPPMALVLAARDIDPEAQPDEGAQAEVARARDAREDQEAAEKDADTAEAEAAGAERKAAKEEAKALELSHEAPVDDA